MHHGPGQVDRVATGPPGWTGLALRARDWPPGSESFANLHEQLLTWEECQPLLADFCAEVGLPAPSP